MVAGCGHPTVNISASTAPPALTSTPASVPGIPFYVKHGMCKRETVWAEPRHTLQLEIQQGGKPVETRSITFARSFLRKPEVETLVENLNLLAAPPKAGTPEQLCNAVDEVARQWQNMAREADAQKLSCDVAPPSGCVPLANAETDGDLLRLSNTASIVTEVDYEHVYYLNSKTPWIGNAQVNATLGADGTLTTASAQVTDQTWSTILGSISALAGDFTTFASAAMTANPGLLKMTAISCSPSSGWPLPSADVVYRITPSTVVYLHDHVLEDTGLGASCKPIEGGVTEGSVTITKQDESKAKDDGNAIKVSGTVTLPKADAAAKK
jgi:hypothetical protein